MKTLLSDSDFTSDSSFRRAGRKSRFAEALLTTGAILFWLGALPFIAVVLALVKVSDTCIALVTGHAIRSNPLILRRGPARSSHSQVSPQTARA
ncbi:MAG TPA: hypothetical protein VGI60_02850 [Chthoniobacterales bacterium]|jgi:hypothetical protein